MHRRTRALCALVVVLFSVAGVSAVAQSLTAGLVQGTVTDPSGAVIPGAKVTIENPVSGYSATATTNAAGQFTFENVPFNHYHVSTTARGFAVQQQDIDVRTTIPIALKVTLPLQEAQTQVNVEGTASDVVENEPTAHTDVDSSLIQKIAPSRAAGLNSVIAMATPGVVADSNSMFHPQGEHADTQFNIDNQPITDQTSKTFSNQISSNVVQSMELITGVAPAEFGDKASLVVRTTTRSGLGTGGPHGGVSASYGSFGTETADFNLETGNQRWGNFVAVDGLNSGRFLDTPEFLPMHDHGNASNFFDRLDYKFSENDTLHLNLTLARSWFQLPNTYDQQAAGQDQRQQTRSFNFAPGYTHLFNASTLLTANAWVRQDRVGYFPSSDIFNDQPATLSANRRLTDTGLKADLAYSKGIHNLKGGIQFSHTFLSEDFQTGVTDPLFNAVCVDATGAPVVASGVVDPTMCGTAGFAANPDFATGLLPFDLTRGGQLFRFQGRADIKQEAAYIQDSINWKNFNFNVGLRGDNYDGLSSGYGVQPRLGISYQVKNTGTVLRVSYGRFFLTPYNENLVLSSSTGQGGLSNVFGGFGQAPIEPARRNHFEVGLQQGFDGWFVVDGSYFWKFTDGDYDFDVILNTPLAFPIQWRKSKIDGVSIRVSMPARHGFTAYSVMGHTRARFFGPEVGGLIFNSPVDNAVFRIDHDQAFQQNTHLQYQPSKNAPWFGFTWTYESGEVAGEIPDVNTLLTLTGDEQFQAGVFCGNAFATPTSPIRVCGANLGATHLSIPALGTWNPDKNPTRVAARNLFDASVGLDNIFHGDKRKWNLRFTAVNLTNDVALYNYLSTFSGTHFVTPRSYNAELGLDF